jgi:hypothetical protein
MAPKKKQKRNITGLRNQPKATSHVEESVDINFSKAAETCPSNPAMADINGPSDNETPDEGWDAHVKFDSNKPCWELDSEEEDSEHEEDKEGDIEDEVMEAGESNWRNEGLHVGLMVLAIEIVRIGFLMNCEGNTKPGWPKVSATRNFKAKIDIY